MPGKYRHYDGTPRNNRAPARLTDGFLAARWVEKEVLRLKKLGLSFAAISAMITRAAQGEKGTGVNLPDPEFVVLRSNYALTVGGAFQAFKRALNREPAIAAEEYREVDTQRLEDWLLSLAGQIRAGDPDAIRAGVTILKHKANINCYGSFNKPGDVRNNVSIMAQVNNLLSDVDIDREIEMRISRRVGRPVTMDQVVIALQGLPEPVEEME